MSKKRPLKLAYRNHCSLTRHVCIYCGQHANTIDHIPALSVVEFYPFAEKIAVRACSLCNAVLSNSHANSIYTRIAFLIENYPKRFKKLLELPWWTSEELEELSGKLKLEVITSIKKKKMIEKKLEFLKNLHIAGPESIID